MPKGALGILFSVLFVASTIPAASAATPAKSASKKKPAKIAVHVRKGATRQHVALDPHEKLVKKSVVVNGRRKVVYQRVAARPVIPAVPPVMTAGDLAGLNLTKDPLELKSNVALVMDQANSQVLFEKNANVALPIASITKLMTAMVVVEASQDMNEVLQVTEDDLDREKNTGSRLRVGAQLTRANMLHIALMSSENRAASALGRNYPGGLPAFVDAMNAKAKSLGMTETHYVDSSGLSSRNVASARDLAKLVAAAHQHPIIRQYSTDQRYMVDTGLGGHQLQYANTNHLVANPSWEIGLQKTGYISEAGRCLVMQAKIEGRNVIMVFLDSKGKHTRLADASRIRKWIESLKPESMKADTAAPAPTLTQGNPALPQS